MLVDDLSAPRGVVDRTKTSGVILHDLATGIVPNKGDGMPNRCAKSEGSGREGNLLGPLHGWHELADEIERFEHTWLDREGL